MLSGTASAVAPLYLFACLILGGSDQASWHDAVLDVAGLVIIAFAAAAPKPEPLTRTARQFLILSVVAVAIIALQEIRVLLLPWGHGGGSALADPYRVEQPGPWCPIWLMPLRALGTSLALVPPLATFCAVVRLGPVRRAWLVTALLAGAFAAIVASALQFGTFAGAGSRIGFSNPDHLADLLIITFPFIAAIAPSAKVQEDERYSGLLLISAALALLMIFGLALTGSIAGYVLAVPVLAASALIVLPLKDRVRKATALLAAVLALGAIPALVASEQIRDRVELAGNSSVDSSRPPLSTLAKAITDHMPWGSGLGSFARIFPIDEENGAAASAKFSHAHNDYAEIALELGLPGIALILLFLTLWGTASWSVWRKDRGVWFSRAASIASAAMLVDSLVDFPLRTAAISACFGTCIALLAGRRLPARSKSVDLRPARHLVFE